jgi:glycosyltransferase involved in cell wall biosynthesis
VDLYIHDYAGHMGQAEVARALAERGHSVCFSYCDALATPRGDLAADPALPRLTIEPIGIGQPIIKKNYFKRQWQDLLYARALVRHIRGRRPQLVISANNPLIPQRALVAHCRRERIPTVHWWTDVYSRAVKHGVGDKFGPLGPLIAAYYERLEIRLLNKSQAVLAIAPRFRTIADEWGVTTPLTVIPVAAPTSRMKPGLKRNAWSERHGIADTTNVLYSGTLGNKHHPELLWELARSLQKSRPDARVIVVAEGVGADWLRAQQEQTPLGNLILLPFQSFEDYADVLAAGDLHVTLLNREASTYALPSKVMSQLCAGRAQAALVPSDNYAGDLIAAAGAGIVAEPADFAATLPQIEALLDHPETRASFAASGRRYAEEQLSLESLIPKYEKLFADLIGPAATASSPQKAAPANRERARAPRGG